MTSNAILQLLIYFAVLIGGHLRRFLERVLGPVERLASLGAGEAKIALDILLAALSIVFLLATATLLTCSLYSVHAGGQGLPITITVLVALLV